MVDAAFATADGNSARWSAFPTVLGVRDDRLQMQEIFAFDRVGVTDAGKVQGRFRATGVSPKILERLRVSGIQVSARTNIFEKTVSVNL